MNTSIEEIDGKLIATLDGEMDTAAAMEAEEALKGLYNTGGKDVIIDCSKLEYIASSKDCTTRTAKMSSSTAPNSSISPPAACAFCSASSREPKRLAATWCCAESTKTSRMSFN